MSIDRNNRRAVALVLAIFVLGLAIGALGTYVWGARVWGARPEHRSDQDRRAHMEEQLRQELSLTAEQQKDLDTILVDMQGKFKAVHEQMNPQFEQLRHQGRERIRAILTPEQRPKFEDFLRRIDEERKKKSANH